MRCRKDKNYQQHGTILILVLILTNVLTMLTVQLFDTALIQYKITQNVEIALDEQFRSEQLLQKAEAVLKSISEKTKTDTQLESLPKNIQYLQFIEGVDIYEITVPGIKSTYAILRQPKEIVSKSSLKTPMKLGRLSWYRTGH